MPPGAACGVERNADGKLAEAPHARSAARSRAVDSAPCRRKAPTALYSRRQRRGNRVRSAPAPNASGELEHSRIAEASERELAVRLARTTQQGDSPQVEGPGDDRGPSGAEEAMAARPWRSRAERALGREAALPPRARVRALHATSTSELTRRHGLLGTRPSRHLPAPAGLPARPAGPRAAACVRR